jgi:hypothetical protein
MEYYSAIKNNDMWFEGKRMQMKESMLSEVSQDQKHKSIHYVKGNMYHDIASEHLPKGM